MTRSEALALLESQYPSYRVRGAIEISVLGEAEDLVTLQALVRNEPVPQVRKRLQAAVRAISSKASAIDGPLAQEELPDDVESQAFYENLGRIVVHELDPAIGILRLARLNQPLGDASGGLDNAIENLERHVSAVSKLVAANPLAVQLESVDIAALVAETASMLDVVVVLGEEGAGLDTIQSDRDLLQTILSNALVNAREATAGLDRDRAAVEVTTLIESDRYEVSISNQIGGSAPSQREVQRVGFSTKGRGRGLGLLVIRASARIIGATAELQVNGHRATFVLSGPKAPR